MDKSVILLSLASDNNPDSADDVDGIQFGRTKGIKDDLKKNPEMNSKISTFFDCTQLFVVTILCTRSWWATQSNA